MDKPFSHYESMWAFLDVQGQLILQAEVGSDHNLSKRKCMFISASIKRIGSKTIKKKRRHHFPHYKSNGVFLDVQGQITT